MSPSYLVSDISHEMRFPYGKKGLLVMVYHKWNIIEVSAIECLAGKFLDKFPINHRPEIEDAISIARARIRSILDLLVKHRQPPGREVAKTSHTGALRQF